MRAILTALCAIGCALPLPLWAARTVHVYEVDVEGPSVRALQDAMRTALVRATGRRESSDDPALASIVADAGKYVKNYTTGPRGESQVVFDGAVVDAAISAAGRSLWQRERPFTLVVLEPPRGHAAEDAARAELERVAAERGLPISLIPMSVTDSQGNPLSAQVLLQGAQRYGGDQILVGRGDSPTADTPLQWTLYTQALSGSWSGSLTTAIDHTVDLLVPAPATSLAQADAEAPIEIDGVRGLSDYAAVERLLQSVPGVRRANLTGVDPGSVFFVVTVRGGAAGLEQALTGSARLVHSGTSGAAVYRYQPQS